MTEDEYRAALVEVDALARLAPAPDTAEGRRLIALADEITVFETESGRDLAERWKFICPDCLEHLPTKVSPCPECGKDRVESLDEWWTHQVPVSDEVKTELDAKFAEAVANAKKA